MRNKRYYDDSDDMIERVRKAREAFDKKIRSFQGVDWPYYTKRTIKGQLKETGDALGQQTSNDTQDPEPNPPSAQASTAEVDSASQQTTAHQAASWWATRREEPNTNSKDEKPDQSSTEAIHSDKKADE
jgi:hypothetical protein